MLHWYYAAINTMLVLWWYITTVAWANAWEICLEIAAWAHGACTSTVGVHQCNHRRSSLDELQHVYYPGPGYSWAPPGAFPVIISLITQDNVRTQTITNSSQTNFWCKLTDQSHEFAHDLGIQQKRFARKNGIPNFWMCWKMCNSGPINGGQWTRH